MPNNGQPQIEAQEPYIESWQPLLQFPTFVYPFGLKANYKEH